jgi:hypothetical protein
VSVLNVITWLWKQPSGRAEFTAEHVNRWGAMVRQNLAMPHQLSCVTDHPEGIDPSIRIIVPPRDFEHIRIPTWNEKKPQCLRRLSMFSPRAGLIFGERFVSMDLDCVISGPLDPLFDLADDFKMMVSTSPTLRPYNGSMLLMTAGARPQVYTEFTPERATLAGKHFLGSDQAWIGFCLGWGEKTWTDADGAIWFSPRYSMGVPETARIMFFPGTPKPWQVGGSRPLDRWVRRHYATGMKEAA